MNLKSAQSSEGIFLYWFGSSVGCCKLWQLQCGTLAYSLSPCRLVRLFGRSPPGRLPVTGHRQHLQVSRYCNSLSVQHSLRLQTSDPSQPLAYNRTPLLSCEEWPRRVTECEHNGSDPESPFRRNKSDQYMNTVTDRTVVIGLPQMNYTERGDLELL